MAPGGRGTRTGLVQEQMVAAALTANGYSFKMHVKINHQLFGNVYIADFLVKGVNGDIIVSLKWQQTPGTAEQKIIYEIATLIDIVKLNQSIKKHTSFLVEMVFHRGNSIYEKSTASADFPEWILCKM
jgi:hypothetical protein